MCQWVKKLFNSKDQNIKDNVNIVKRYNELVKEQLEIDKRFEIKITDIAFSFYEEELKTGIKNRYTAVLSYNVVNFNTAKHMNINIYDLVEDKLELLRNYKFDENQTVLD